MSSFHKQLPILLAFGILTIASLHSGVDAFVPSSPSVCSNAADARAPFQSNSNSNSQLNFFSGYEMGGTDAVNDHDDETEKASSSSSSSLDESEDPLFFASLVTKAIIILIIKTAKDIVNYPPNLLDEYNRYQQMRNQEIANTAELEYKPEEFMMSQQKQEQEDDSENPTLAMASVTAKEEEPTAALLSLPSSSETLPIELTRTNPFILLAKFLGVLTYKTMHDAIYYPALWINDYLHPPRNNDDDYYYYY
mmetsp:Transcript_36045/g.87117  ORF Transcript_36045/g.87117 Transcript_36045/m.87117 type:complete len:251 (+) Transcript_36045:163-915(+)|eukprot:CAMPEP_0113616988 /NCGR_PEP_ID=MMETSP0017_2-20120614/8533_1 /TAXON_ID=2856 /ORGANISM="Cylindrotheca closterium" /LENGTH=250 /DNA_ID=CAMNT_0000526339 /DNA_START=8 /DNA_END=760 /DNA_ORIENTATION=- /assembly_acc=CAM_ASM_000147